MSQSIIIGRKYGRLTIIELSGMDINGNKYFRCRCDCGNEKEVSYRNMHTGHTKSCGCYMLEARRSAKSHGMTHEKLYGVWKAMIERCTKKGFKAYDRYGGRGITVCDEWMDLNAFVNWAKENGYREKLEIDRIDNDGNYEPDNCKWSTKEQQSRNRSTNISITIDGETKILKDWAEHFGVCYSTVQYRLYRGVGVLDLFKPVKKSKEKGA
jgi:hypothetical protein